MNRRRLLFGFAALPVAWPVFAQARQKEVLAFYYGWYGTPGISGQYIHWQNPDLIRSTIDDAPNFPVSGPYDSLDKAVIARHVKEAADAGITGLIVSWWGQKDRTNQQLKILLEAAAKRGLKITAYIEQANTPEALVEDIFHLHQSLTRHSSWLTDSGKPVIFLFDRVLQSIGLEGWSQARKQIEARAPNALLFAGTANTLAEIADRQSHFDILHIYSMQFEASDKRLLPALWRMRFYQSWVKAQTGLRVTTATILPGYDDTHLPDRSGDRPTVKRNGGRTYEQLWQAAIRARPDWVLIVSFNEWHEGSELETSIQNGTRELTTTRLMSAQFRAK